MNIVFLPSNNDDDFLFIDPAPDGVPMLRYLADHYISISGGPEASTKGVTLDIAVQQVQTRTYMLVRAFSNDWKTVYCNDFINNSLNCLNARCFVYGDIYLMMKDNGEPVTLTAEALKKYRKDFEHFDMHTEFGRNKLLPNKDHDGEDIPE